MESNSSVILSEVFYTDNVTWEFGQRTKMNISGEKVTIARYNENLDLNILSNNVHRMRIICPWIGNLQTGSKCT